MWFKPKLTREPVVIDQPDESRKALAVKARVVLGYLVLEREIPGSNAKTEVETVFKKLGIEPLNFERVQKYQKWFAKKHSGSFSWERTVWHETPIRQYEHFIPEFALSRAVEVKEHLPAAEFTIEFPVREQIVRPDPFMVIHYKGTKYYLDVWDEPKFEGRRTV